MLFTIAVTVFSAALAHAFPTAAGNSSDLTPRDNFQFTLCTNFVDSSNPSAQQPCITFNVPSDVINTDFGAQVDTAVGFCQDLEKLPGGGCPSSVQILQKGSCVFSTSFSGFGGCCTPGATTQVVSDTDGLVNLKGELNDNVNCFQCDTTQGVDFCGIFNDGK